MRLLRLERWALSMQAMTAWLEAVFATENHGPRFHSTEAPNSKGASGGQHARSAASLTP